MVDFFHFFVAHHKQVTRIDHFTTRCALLGESSWTTMYLRLSSKISCFKSNVFFAQIFMKHPKKKHMGVSTINHPFWGTPIFWKHPYQISQVSWPCFFVWWVPLMGRFYAPRKVPEMTQIAEQMSSAILDLRRGNIHFPNILDPLNYFSGS